MALNFLGLGFSFGAKDKGLRKSLGGIREDFASIGKEILSLQRLQTFLQAMTFDKLDALSDKLRGIGVEGLNLSSNLENTFQQNSVEARKFAVNAGIAAKDVGKFTAESANMAYALNIGAEEAGKALKGFKDFGGALRAMGIDSAEAFAKLSKVSGIDAHKFSYDLKQVQDMVGEFKDEADKPLKLTDDLLAGIVASAKAYGETVGDVGGTLSSLADDIKPYLRDQINFYHKTPAQAAKFVQSYYTLSSVFQKLGPQGKEMAKSIADSMNAAGGDISKLIAGTGQDLPTLYKEMATTFGMTEQQISELLRSDPSTFIGTLSDRVETLSKTMPAQVGPALDFMRNRFEGAFGKETSDMLALTLQDSNKRAELSVTKLGERSQEIAQTAGKSLGNIVKDGYQSSMSFTEQFSRLQEAQLQNFRNKTSISQAKFMKEAKKSFQDFNKTVDDLYKKGGVGKFVVQTIADVEKFGMLAFVPKNLIGGVSTIGSAIEKLASPIAKLRAAGINLMTPMGLLSGAALEVGLQFASLRKVAKENIIADMMKKGMSKKQAEEYAGGWFGPATEDALRALGAKIYKFFAVTLPKHIPKAIHKLAEGVRKLIRGGVVGGFRKGDLGDIWGNVFSAIKEELVIAWAGLKNFFGGLWNGLLGKFDPEEKTDTTFLGGALGHVLRKVFVKAFKVVGDFLGGAWEGLMGRAVPDDASGSKKLGNKIFTKLREAFLIAYDYTKRFLTGLWHGLFNEEYIVPDGDKTMSMGNTIGLKVREAFDVAYEYISNYLKNWWANIKAIWADPDMTFGEKMIASLKESGGIIAGLIGLFALFGPQIMSVLKFLGSILNILKPIFSILTDAVKLLFSVPWGSIFSGLWNTLDFLWMVLEPILMGIGQLAGFAGGAATAIGALIAAVVALTVGFMAWPDETQSVVDSVISILKGMGDWVGKALVWMFMWPWKVIYEMVEWFVGDLSTATAGAFNPTILLDKLFNFLGNLGPALAEALNSITSMIQALLNGMMDGIKNALVSFFPAFAGPITAVMDFIKGFLNGIWSLIKVIVSAIGEVISVVMLVVSGAVGILTSLFGTLWMGVVWVFDKIGALFKGLYSLVAPIVDPIISFFGRLWSGITNGAAGAIAWMKEKFLSIKDWVTDLLNSLDSALAKLPGGEAAQKRIDARNADRQRERDQLAKEKERAAGAAVAVGAVAPPPPPPTPAAAAPTAGGMGLKMPDFSKLGAAVGDAVTPGYDPRFAPKGTAPAPATTPTAPARAVPVVPPTTPSVPRRTNAGTPAPTAEPIGPTFDDLVKGVNEPDWVTKMMEEQKRQHRELMAALKPPLKSAGAPAR